MEERILNRNKLLENNAHNIAENYNNGQYDNVLNGLSGFYESLSICLICDSESSINDANEIIKGNNGIKITIVTYEFQIVMEDLKVPQRFRLQRILCYKNCLIPNKKQNTKIYINI